MFRHQFVEDVGIHIFTAYAPFNSSQLFKLGNLRQGRRTSDLWQPSLFDFRRVDLANINIAELRRLIIRRKALGAKHDDNPAAFLVRDMRSFAMARLGSIFADLTQLRSESQTFITTEVPEVINWLAETMSIEQSQFQTLRQSIG